MLPFSYYAIRGQIAQARLAPLVQALRKRYASQPERLHREITELRRNEGTPALAGCLPAILQWPFLSVLYLVLRSPVVGGMRNVLLTHRLLGVPLGAYWFSGAGIASVHGAVFAGLLMLLAAAGWLSARCMRRWAPPARAGEVAWASRLAPFTAAAVAAFLPLAAGVYLLTTSAWTLLERTFLPRLRPGR